MVAPAMDYAKHNSPYFKKNPQWHVEDSPFKAGKVLEMLHRNRLSPKSIAEIGCGAGEILNQLHQRMEDKSVRFAGYEIAPDAFELCKQRKKERLEYFQADLSSTKATFDLLLMIDVFEHVDDYLGFIAKYKDRATHKLYHIPLDMSALPVLTNWIMEERKSVGHLHYFMKDTAMATLLDTGQEIVDWFYTRPPLKLFDNHLNLFGNAANILRNAVYGINPDFCVKAFGGYSLMVLTK